MHTGAPDFATTQRIEATLLWIEAFKFEARLEWLNSSSANWQRAGAAWFTG
jgi:hypothetical protein